VQVALVLVVELDDDDDVAPVDVDVVLAPLVVDVEPPAVVLVVEFPDPLPPCVLVVAPAVVVVSLFDPDPSAWICAPPPPTSGKLGSARAEDANNSSAVAPPAIKLTPANEAKRRTALLPIPAQRRSL
jgi:hypothetical protein